MPTSQTGVKYQIAWCREVGVLPAECRARLELLPGNGDKVAPDGQVLHQRKLQLAVTVRHGRSCSAGGRMGSQDLAWGRYEWLAMGTAC